MDVFECVEHDHPLGVQLNVARSEDFSERVNSLAKDIEVLVGQDNQVLVHLPEPPCFPSNQLQFCGLVDLVAGVAALLSTLEHLLEVPCLHVDVILEIPYHHSIDVITDVIKGH